MWRIYDVREPGGLLILEIDLLKEPVKECVRKLLSISRPLLTEEVKEVKTIATIQMRLEEKVEVSLKQQLDLDRVREFLNNLTPAEKAFIEVLYQARKEGRKLSKDEVIKELGKKGINVDRKGFTGVKSGITRQCKRLGLPTPMPTQDEYESLIDERDRYVLREEWVKALDAIFEEERRRETMRRVQ